MDMIIGFKKIYSQAGDDIRDPRPHGGLAGRVGIEPAITYTLICFGIKFTVWAANEIYTVYNEKTQEAYNTAMVAYEKKLDAMNKEESERQKHQYRWMPGAQPPRPHEGLDDGGRDFLLVMREAASKLEMDKTWQRIRTGKILPEGTDVRREFADWLKKGGANEQPILSGLPLPEDDETCYAFLYWIWRGIGRKEPPQSKLWYYLWKKGYPIDPVDPPVGLSSRILYISGNYDPVTNRLKLSFLG